MNLAILIAGVNTRQSPSTAAPLVFQTSVPRTYALVFGKSSPADGNPHQWLELRFDDGTEGWVRADVVWQLVGDFTLLGGSAYDAPVAGTVAFPPTSTGVVSQPPQNAMQGASGATTGGKWASPVDGTSVVTEGFHPPTHYGVDEAGAVGTPIVARGKGIVYQVTDCPHCPGGNGAALGTSDPLTAYGFGISVITRHAYSDLPGTAQAAMDAAGLKGGWCFIRTAHMNSRVVGAGVNVSAGALLGYRGNSGNSSGPHTHVETRASMDSQPADVFSQTLIDPNAVLVL